MAERGYVAMGGGPDAYKKHMEAEIGMWAKVIRAANIKAQ